MGFMGVGVIVPESSAGRLVENAYCRSGWLIHENRSWSMWIVKRRTAMVKVWRVGTVKVGSVMLGADEEAAEGEPKSKEILGSWMEIGVSMLMIVRFQYNDE